MTKYAVALTRTERTFGPEEIIVSKTDERGRITYANDIFCRVALYTKNEVLGQPHSIVRHPGIPRCVFKLLWDTIESGQEIFVYVKNMAKNGDFYWVFAHVTPSFGPDNKIVGFHSNRRCPRPEAIKAIGEIESRIANVREVTTIIASAVTEQTAATSEISSNVHQAADGAQDISSNVTMIKSAAEESGGIVNSMHELARALSREADMLRANVEEFLMKLAAT